MVRKWWTVVFWEWEEKKSVEQWCFGIKGKSQKCRTKGKGETIGGVRHQDGEGMEFKMCEMSTMVFQHHEGATV
jgi:hypothetical protein